MKDRATIIKNFRTLQKEVRQIFIDAEAWNEYSHARMDGCDPVDPDPFGEMRRLLTALDELLTNDPGHGPIASLKFERSH